MSFPLTEESLLVTPEHDRVPTVLVDQNTVPAWDVKHLSRRAGTISLALNSQEKNTIPICHRVGGMIVEGRMHALGCEWHSRDQDCGFESRSTGSNSGAS